MSKKRHLSLSSKWKLSKENKDYKQHKINKRVGGAGYAEGEPEKVRRKKRSNFSSKICKKTRGKHVWELFPHKYKVMRDSYNFYKCEKCGKEKWQKKVNYECAKCGESMSWIYGILRHKDKRVCTKCGCKKFNEIMSPNLEEQD